MALRRPAKATARARVGRWIQRHGHADNRLWTRQHGLWRCDVALRRLFNRITPANVRIVYAQPAAPAGLGFAGRPSGPVPTIKISLQNMPFRFFFLGNLLGFRDMQIPSAMTTMTGEGLYSCSPIMRRGCSGSH